MNIVCVCVCRAHDGLIRDVTEGHGMDRNRDQLNKAYEAYRNASIEKDNAKKELKHKVWYRPKKLWHFQYCFVRCEMCLSICMVACLFIHNTSIESSNDVCVFRQSSLNAILSSWKRK